MIVIKVLGALLLGVTILWWYFRGTIALLSYLFS